MVRIYPVSALCGAALLSATSASAQAVRPNPGFMATDLGRSDDGSSEAVPLGFSVIYAGTTYDSLYVDTNGYVAFEKPPPVRFTGSSFRQRLIAPFFADVDTSAPESGTVHYGPDMVGARSAFGVTWPGVGYYNTQADKLDSFQLVIIERGDVAPGSFDVELNYETIAWESGSSATGSVAGLGGQPSALVGYSDGVTDTLMPGSGTPGSFLDDNSVTGLARGSDRATVPGRYVLEFRDQLIADAGGSRDSGGAADGAGAPEGAEPGGHDGDARASTEGAGGSGPLDAAPGGAALVAQGLPPAAPADGARSGGCGATDAGTGSWRSTCALWVLLASPVALRRRPRAAVHPPK
jgi:hypothetical protein